MKILTIIKKEYREIVRKKMFIISTILTPVVMAGMMFLPMLLMKIGREEKVIAVADYTDSIYDKLAINDYQHQAPQPKTVKTNKMDIKGSMDLGSMDVRSSKLTFKKIACASRAPADVIKEYEKNILTKDKAQHVDGFLMIPADVRQTRKLAFYALSVSDIDTIRFISASIRTIISKMVLIDKQIDPVIVNEATRDIDMDTFKVKKEGTTKSSSGLDLMMPMFMFIMMFFILIMYGQLMMRGVLEEKNSRIIEILISSVSATQMFFGKIIGIGLAGLTQVGIWILFIVVIVSRFSSGIDASLLTFFTPEIAIYFVIFFSLGFFMYAILFALVGAAVNTDQEAQQLSSVITWTLMIPYFLGMIMIQNTTSSILAFASLFPFFTPILMFMRITSVIPPLWQITAGIAITLLTIYFLAWLGARIFRIGILMYGKKPTLGEILRWMRYK